MYTAYFGLNESPFSIAPDPLYLYMSEHHREALAHLQYGIKIDGGFVLLTGEIGAGKTTLCRSLLEQLPEDVDIAYILNPKVSVIELLETICDELHIERPEEVSVKKLVDRINTRLLEANAQGRKTVLIIDEAQNLSVEVLEQLRLLTNLETNRYKLLKIVLLGQPELLQILNRAEMRQLSQRVTARCHLGPLDMEDVGAYVRHRLEIAGCTFPLFPESLNKPLWQITGGIPRLINLVCDRALLGAYARERKQVDLATLRQAANEVLGELKPQQGGGTGALAVGLVALALVCFAAGYWLWRPDRPVSSSTSTVSLSPPPTPAVSETVPVTPASPASTNSRASTDGQDGSGTSAEGPVTVAASATPTSAELPAKAEQARPLEQTWPAGFATARSMDEAFADLIGLWGIAPPIGNVDFCSYAHDHRLDCLNRRDSLETLRTMDRPAILTLYGDDGEPFHVVMAALGSDRALFVAGEEKHELALSALASRWFGEYLLLWQRPPLRQEFLHPGESGDSVKWLAQTLQELGLYQATGREVRLEGALLGAFKHFQFSNGLTPDGILGPMSLIHLNTAGEQTGPRLDNRETS